MVFRFLFWLIIACIFPVSVSAVDGVVVNDIDIDQRVHDQANTNSVISAFADEFSGFFFVPGE